jgi:hypothetical protein
MTSPAQRAEDLQGVAVEAVERSLQSLFSHDDYADLADLVPPSFAADLVELAWRHQFDLDTANFRREAKKYLNNIAAGEDATLP